MDQVRRSYGEELVGVLAAATAALEALAVEVSRLSGRELDGVTPVIDRLGALVGAGRSTVTVEAQERGEIAASQAGSVGQWVAERCPSLDRSTAGVVARAVRELSRPGLGSARSAVAAELRQLTPLLADGADEPVLAGLVEIGTVEGVAGVRGLRAALLARYGLGEVIQEEQDRHAGLTQLSCGADIGGGVSQYPLRLTPESRAVVEAAVNALSAPRVTDGVPDARTSEQRRGDALVQVCRTALALVPAVTAATAEDAATAASPWGTKATVVVSIGLDDLRPRTRPGVLLGGLHGGTVLGPETVRRLASDTRLVPAVLDSPSQPLDLGQGRRLFSTTQVLALWLRDRHCTFPGCRTPASWCDAHHLTHWVDGGPTNLSNAALLCARHHSIVHRDRLHGVLTPTGVAWDRRPLSYHHHLPRSTLPDNTEDGGDEMAS